MSRTGVGEVERTRLKTPRQDLRSESGALRSERLGCCANPVIKVADLVWLDFEKPDLGRPEVSAWYFGFVIAARTESEL